MVTENEFSRREEEVRLILNVLTHLNTVINRTSGSTASAPELERALLKKLASYFDVEVGSN